MSELREKCQHRWPDIVTALGFSESYLNNRHQACFDCGGKDRARFTDYMGTGSYICNQCCPESIDGFELMMRFTGKDFKGVASDIRAIIGDTQARPAQNADVAKIRTKLTGMWAEAKPLAQGCPTHLYLLNRGLSGLMFSQLNDIRCHPALTYWHSEGGEIMNLGKHPAMVAMVRSPDGSPATLHCTYLTHKGDKAALDPVRKLMTPAKSWKGGAVRLQHPEDGQTLCVAEGIETALSMKLLHPEVCPWACISAGNLESFLAPHKDSATIYIAGDNDASFTGQAAAFALAKRLSKKHEAFVLMPEQINTDFNDELVSRLMRKSA